MICTHASKLRPATAILADLDEGLVVTTALAPIPRICSGSLASCVAVILQSPGTAGIAHTSLALDELPAAVDAIRDEFQSQATGDVALTVAFSSDGYRVELAAQVRNNPKLPLETFVEANAVSPAVAREVLRWSRNLLGAGTMERITFAIHALADMRAEKIAEWAARAGVRAVDVSNDAFLVSAGGTIESYAGQHWARAA